MEAHHRSHHKSEHVTTVTLYNWIEFTSVQSHQKFTLAGEHRFARGAPRVSIYKFRGWIRRNEGIAPCIFHSWQSIVSILPQEGRIDSEPRDRDEVGIHRMGARGTPSVHKYRVARCLSTIHRYYYSFSNDTRCNVAKVPLAPAWEKERERNRETERKRERGENVTSCLQRRDPLDVYEDPRVTGL